ncbi:MAG: MFS transporter [Chlamydiae bacterium]|nr:MFS transporter [Chlamydiota bacterium]
MKKSILLASLFYSFVEYLSFFIVTSLFTPLILAQNSLYKDPFNLIKEPELLLGVILGVYGLGIFLGAPLLGKWSDHKNRKQALQISMALNILGNIGVGIFFASANVWMMIFFRFITGLGSSGAQLLYNVVQDMESEEKKRGKAMGYLVAVSSFATVLGPAFGTLFAGDSGIMLGIPFFVLGFFGMCSMLFTHLSFGQNATAHKGKHQSFLEIFTKPEVLIVGISYFLFLLIAESLFVAIPIVMVLGFDVSSDWIALFFAYGGLVSVFTGTFILPCISRFFSVRLAYLTSLLGLTLSLFSFFLSSTPEELFVPFTFFALFATLAWSKGNELILAVAEKKNTGIIMGVFGSLIALAVLLASLFMGYFATLSSLLPLLVLCIMGLINFAVAVLSYRKLARQSS